MLGTTKPPYTLALIAALLRERGCDVRLVDLTADAAVDRRRSSRGSTRGVPADAHRLSEHDADARRRRRRDGEAQGALRRAAVLLRPARLDDAGRRRWSARRTSTACSSASRKTALLALAALDSLDRLRRDAEPRRSGAGRHRSSPHRAHGQFAGFLHDAVSRRGICSTARALPLPLVNKPYVHRRDAAAAARTRATSASRRSTRATSSARRSAKALVDEIERGYRELGLDVLLPLGRHGHAEREDVQRVLRRADRAQPADPVVRQRARRQPDRSGVRQAAARRPAAGCSRSASSPSRKRSART